MGRTDMRDHFNFALMLGFGLASLLRKPSSWGDAGAVFAGYLKGTSRLLFTTLHG